MHDEGTSCSVTCLLQSQLIAMIERTRNSIFAGPSTLRHALRQAQGAPQGGQAQGERQHGTFFALHGEKEHTKSQNSCACVSPSYFTTFLNAVSRSQLPRWPYPHAGGRRACPARQVARPGCRC